MPGWSSVVELRQYTVYADQRDTLIELFDRDLAAPQEAVGMHVVGQFRDVDRPDRFVWIRAFPDMAARRAALKSFYGGPVWQAHRTAANATMVDVDDVLLLRPVPGSPAFAEVPTRSVAAYAGPATLIAVTICSLDRPARPEVLACDLLPALSATTAPPVATLVEEPSENTFPALPIREGEHVVVWIQRAGDGASAAEVLDASRQLAKSAVPGLIGEPVQLRLEPTPWSRLR